MDLNGNNKNDLIEGLIRLRRYFANVIDLKSGVKKREVIEDISAKKSMGGANSWMLMCSIVIASIGLDIDSPVIIIGAMLISPLMSTILGIGVGVAINDKELLKDSMVQFGIAALIAIFTSTLYFLVSPFGELTEQIRLRTEPTFLDIPIAFFGGIAGIVSLARKDISTALPGVAIATALMPPLCVVGYGLSCLAWSVAASAFYLFFLNTFFVSLATYLIIRFMNFPYKQYLDESKMIKNRRYIYVISLLVTIPSLLIFSKVYKRFNETLTIKHFINDDIGDDKIYLDDYQLLDNDENRVLILKVYGDRINKSSIEDYEKKLDKLGLPDIKVKVISTADINLDRVNHLESRVNSVDDIRKQLNAIIEKQEMQKTLQLKELNSPKYMTIADTIKRQDYLEIKAVFPNINNLYIAHGSTIDSSGIVIKNNFALVEWHSTKQDLTTDSTKLVELLKIKYQLKDIELITRN